MSASPIIVFPERADRDPWERQRGESRMAYQAFEKFRDAEEPRTIRRVARELGKHEKLCYQWSAKWKWQARLYAWLDYLNRIQQTERINAIKEINARHSSISKMLQQKIINTLRLMREDERIPFAQLAQLLSVSVDIERLANDLSVSTSKGKGIESSLLEPQRPAAEDIVSERIRKLSPVDRDLLRQLYLKQLRAFETAPETIKLLEQALDDGNTITVTPETNAGSEQSDGEVESGS